MKKIYLLLVLLFTGLQSVFAQFIWHSDLGTPHTGTVSLSWDTRSYMFQVDNGEEFGSTGDIWDALDAQLRAAGITWIRRGFRISIRRFGVQRSLFRSFCISLFFRCDGYEFSGEWQYATPVLQFICQGQWCNDSNYKFRRLGFSQ